MFDIFGGNKKNEMEQKVFVDDPIIGCGTPLR